MITTIQRVLAGALILAAITAPAVLQTPPAVAAARQSSDFVLEVFPNETAQVEFDDDWSERRPGGRRHRGTDIKSPKGTQVVAVAAGIVEEMKWHRAGGWSIEIRHAGGWSTHYLHLNDDSPGTNDGRGGAETAFAEGLEEGSIVAAGRVIGSSVIPGTPKSPTRTSRSIATAPRSTRFPMWRQPGNARSAPSTRAGSSSDDDDLHRAGRPRPHRIPVCPGPLQRCLECHRLQSPPGPTLRASDHPRIRAPARLKTASSISSVSLPVKVFC